MMNHNFKYCRNTNQGGNNVCMSVNNYYNSDMHMFNGDRPHQSM